MSVTKEQIMSVKGRGFLLNRGTECFSGRLVSIGGVFSADDLKVVAECAEKFGNGNVIFTSRLSAEIVGIPFDKIPLAESFVEGYGMQFGGTGAKIRPITACKGTTCVFGNIDTQGLAKALHERFYIGMRSVNLPHKFKIGVGGCPNSCMKPSLNDVGIEGCKLTDFDLEKCRGCNTCLVAENCPSKAVSTADNKAVVDKSICTKCGVCVGKCPFEAVPKKAESVCRVYVGGTWGKKQRMGTLLSGVFKESEVADVVEKVMLWYKENAYQKERLGAAIDRLGIEKLESAIATDDLILRKAEIIAAPIRQK